MKMYIGDKEITGIGSWEIGTIFPKLSSDINEIVWVLGPDKVIEFLKSKLVEIEDYKKQIEGIQGKVEDIMKREIKATEE